MTYKKCGKKPSKVHNFEAWNYFIYLLFLCPSTDLIVEVQSTTRGPSVSTEPVSKHPLVSTGTTTIGGATACLEVNDDWVNRQEQYIIIFYFMKIFYKNHILVNLKIVHTYIL